MPDSTRCANTEALNQHESSEYRPAEIEVIDIVLETLVDEAILDIDNVYTQIALSKCAVEFQALMSKVKLH